MSTLSWTETLENACNHPMAGEFGGDANHGSIVYAYFKITMDHPEETSRRIIYAAEKICDGICRLEVLQQSGGSISGYFAKCFERHGRTLRKEVLEAEKSYWCISPKLDEIVQGKIPIMSVEAFRFLEKLPSRYWTAEHFNKALLQDTALQNALTSYPADSAVVKMRAEGLIDTLREAEGDELVLLPRLEQLASGGGHGQD